MNTQITVYPITKEHVVNLRFPKEDVLEKEELREQREYQLTRAMQIGNLLKSKVTLYFKDEQESMLSVRTTIWAVTNKYVVLKKGTFIPLHRIVHIE